MINLIIPTYKARATLPAALDSLVAQTKKFFIVTIVQDCDGEDYTDIIDEYRRRGLKIFLLKTPKNGGPGVARQLGMDSDKMSKFFMFMDSDDILNPRAIEIFSHEAESNNADIITSDFLVDRPGAQSYVMNFETTPCTWTHGKCYRAQYLRDLAIRFRDDLRLNEDSYFNLVANNCTKNKLGVHEVTYVWHQNPNSLTHSDGGTGFFVKSWSQYILSQVYGLMDITARTEIDPGLVAATFINIYTHHMKALSGALTIKCGEYDEFCFATVANALATLKDNEKIMAALRDSKFWGYIVDHLMASEMFDDNIIFYKMRFCDWLKEYVTEEIA